MQMILADLYSCNDFLRVLRRKGAFMYANNNNCEPIYLYLCMLGDEDSFFLASFYILKKDMVQSARFLIVLEKEGGSKRDDSSSLEMKAFSLESFFVCLKKPNPIIKKKKIVLLYHGLKIRFSD